MPTSASTDCWCVRAMRIAISVASGQSSRSAKYSAIGRMNRPISSGNGRSVLIVMSGDIRKKNAANRAT